MKKLLLSLICLSSLAIYGQDTTAFRMVAGSEDEIHFYNDDTTYLESNTITGTTHVIFVNPDDSLLYGIVDAPSQSGDRNLYTIDPFSGTTTLVADLSITYTNSGDLGEGFLYLISGNGDGSPGVVTAVDLSNFNETTLFTSAVSSAGNPTATEYNSSDSSLYIFNSFDYELYVYNLATGTESAATSFSYNGSNDEEHHGAFYDSINDVFLLGSYGSDIYKTNSSPYTTFDMEYDGGYNHGPAMDLCILEYTLRSDTNYYENYCPNVDSFMVSLMYNVTNFSWYKDGVLIPGATNDTIWISDAGQYQALMEIGTSGSFVWSEIIECDPYNVPNVNLSSDGDSMLCSNETMTLTGANPGGGTVQWYMDGTVMTGETGATLNVTMAGVYNQLKTNLNGCMDSSAVGYEVLVDNTPLTVTISNTGNDTEICPDDTITLDGTTTGGTLQWFMNGMAISGETGTSYDAVAAGNYNLMMTLTTGCADSAAQAYVITDDPLCNASISENQLLNEVSVYPIPFVSKLTIEGKTVIESVEIFDLSGKVVYQQSNINKSVISISTDKLEEGVYMLNISDGKNTISRKIVK